jgi:plasmid stabilization system protein ParE
MNAEQGFALHPLAARDITDIWDYIAEDSPLAARRVREEILSAIRALVSFPIRATDARTSHRGLSGSLWCANI